MPYMKKLQLFRGAGLPLLILVLLFSFGTRQADATELFQPTIIINPDIYYPLDEILYLEGRAPANFAIQIQFQKSGVKPIRVIAKSDQNGEWVFAGRAPLEAGNWEIRARAMKNEQVSEWSNPRVVKVIFTGIVLGGVAIKFSVLALIIIGLLVIGGAGTFYYSRKVKRLREESQRTLEQKEREILGSEVEQNFTELRRKVEKELEHIERRLEKGELTDEEKEHREHLIREIKEIEETIEKKIKNSP